MHRQSMSLQCTSHGSHLAMSTGKLSMMKSEGRILATKSQPHQN